MQLFYLNLKKFLAVKRIAAVEIKVANTKITKQNRSITIAVNFQSWLLSSSCSSVLSFLVITFNSSKLVIID